ncbi:MAG: ABC transporter permease subunit [Spirochaetales bacterium]
MKAIDIAGILKLTQFNLLIGKKTIIGWAVAIFCIMFMYMILFPSVQDIANVKMDAMPKEMLQFFGLEKMSDMSDFTLYYGSIFSLVSVALAIFSATFSAGLITKEESTKSIEFLNSLAVSRSEIYISKYITAFVSVILIMFGAVCATLVCGFINGGSTFSPVNIITSAKISAFVPLLFGGFALLCAGINPKIATGSAVSSIVLVSYVLGYLGQLLGDKGNFLHYFSPFITLNVDNALNMGKDVMISTAVYLLLYIVAVIIGCKAYSKRDFQI